MFIDLQIDGKEGSLALADFHVYAFAHKLESGSFWSNASGGLVCYAVASFLRN